MSLVESHHTPEEAYLNCWKALKRATVDKKHPFRYAVMATISGEEIDQRTIVMRAIDQDDQLLFYTDARTKKIKSLQKHVRASLLFYDDKHKVQISMKVAVTLHQKNGLSNQHWSRVQGMARKAYTPLIAPGTPIDHAVEAHQWPDEMTDSFFCVIACRPYQLEILQLSSLEHLRLAGQYESNEWKLSWIAP